MRSGLWAIAFVMSAYSNSGLSQEASFWIFGIAVIFLILDIIEYFKKFNK